MKDPSSRVAPSAPWISFSEALVMWILRTAMKAPSTPPNTVSQVPRETRSGAASAGDVVAALVMELSRLWGGFHSRTVIERESFAGVISAAAGIDTGGHRHAGTQPGNLRVAVIENDLDRYTLHDLGEIAGSVIGGQQAEFGATGGRYTFHNAFEVVVGDSVDID